MVGLTFPEGGLDSAYCVGGDIEGVALQVRIRLGYREASGKYHAGVISQILQK